MIICAYLVELHNALLMSLLQPCCTELNAPQLHVNRHVRSRYTAALAAAASLPGANVYTTSTTAGSLNLATLIQFLPASTTSGAISFKVRLLDREACTCLCGSWLKAKAIHSTSFAVKGTYLHVFVGQAGPYRPHTVGSWRLGCVMPVTSTCT